MRKIQWMLLVLLAVLSISFVACGGDDDPTTPTPTPTPTPVAAKIDIPATENTKPVFGTEGGVATVKFTASQAWTASATNTRADDWLSVTPTSGMAGTYTLTITSKANETYDERGGSITIKSGTASQTIVVTQKQKDALLVTGDKVEIKADGGFFKFNVQSNIDYSVSVDADWITETSTRALQTEELSFRVAANDTYEDRTATITIEGAGIKQTLTVIQDGLIAVTGIELDITNLELKVGNTIKLTATVIPSDAANKEVKWSSSDTSIVTVDEEGNVEALKIGKAVIIVSSEIGNIQATCEISVIPEAVTGVSLSDEEIKLMPGDTRQLTAIIEPDNADNKSVTWSVDDKSIATVDQDGNVVGKKLGQTTVTVKTNDGGYTATCTINVVDITGMVTANILSSSVVMINGYLQPGSQINTYLLNESQCEIIPQSIQFIDGLSGAKSNVMEIDHDVLKGQGVSYTITIRTAYYLPIIRWTYTYEGKDYYADCQYKK